VAGHTPEVAVVDVVAGIKIIVGYPGTESGGILVHAFSDLLARTATLLIAALDRMSTDKIREPIGAATINTQAITWFALRSLSQAIAVWLYRLCYHSPHWRVGWRHVVGEADVVDLRALPHTGFQELPDDGRRFYADPFPVEKNSRLYLFVEEFEHRRGHGVISAVEFSEIGPVGTPHPVLETGFHLSYPFVFGIAAKCGWCRKAPPMKQSIFTAEHRFPMGGSKKELWSRGSSQAMQPCSSMQVAGGC
jgi:hypothetical protein